MSTLEKKPPTIQSGFDPDACPKDAVDKIKKEGLTCIDLDIKGAGLGSAVVAKLSEGIPATLTCEREIAGGKICPYKVRLINEVRGAGVTGEPADEIIKITPENETCLRQTERE
jgi:hypothetical protein